MTENQKPEKTRAKVGDEHYELDLDDGAPQSLEDVFQEAVAQVERKAATRSAQRAEPAPASAAPEDEDDEDDTVSSPGPAPAAEPGDRGRLEAEAASLRDRLARTLADFENYRKRAERDKESTRLYGLAEALKDFLTVADNLKRALAASGNSDDLKKGVEMIHRQLEDVFRRQGVDPIATVGKPFDPNLHEAVSREESAEAAEPTVIAELQKGYMLHDRLLRPALVNVAVPAPRAQPPETADSSAAHAEEVAETAN